MNKGKIAWNEIQKVILEMRVQKLNADEGILEKREQEMEADEGILEKREQ